MPGEVYRGRKVIPEYQLDGFRGNVEVLKASGYRDLFTQMLMKMSETGDKPTDYLIRLAESREPHDAHGMWQTNLEVHAVPIEQARALIR